MAKPKRSRDKMCLFQHIILSEGEAPGYEQAVLTFAQEPPRHIHGIDWWLDALILQIPIPVWNFIPPGKDVCRPMRNVNTEGWMFPCLSFVQKPSGRSIGFFWREWKVRRTPVAPDITKPWWHE